MSGTSLGPTVADVAQLAMDQLVALRRQKAVDDAMLPLIRDLSMAVIQTLDELKVASHKVIEAWRRSSLSDPDGAELRAAIEDLVAASGWKRTDE